MTREQQFKAFTVAAAALREIGHQATVGPSFDGELYVWHGVGDEPSCADTYKAFALGMRAAGLSMKSFDQWHADQDRRATCTCTKPLKGPTW